jgi:hypothetical protein
VVRVTIHPPMETANLKVEERRLGREVRHHQFGPAARVARGDAELPAPHNEGLLS